MSDAQQGGPVEVKNTDTHLWPQVSEDAYAPRVFATVGDGIGIDVGGHVIVKPIRDWHALAAGWRSIETAPRDVDVLMGWWSTWPELFWETAAGLAGSTKGGWLHGQATHWMPLPAPPSRVQAVGE